jgi:hypothetical protein
MALLVTHASRDTATRGSRPDVTHYEALVVDGAQRANLGVPAMEVRTR